MRIVPRSGNFAAIRCNGDVPVPFVWGCWRPAVLLPMEFPQWTESCRRSVLTHELAHVARGDCWWDALSRLLCVVYWFHPAVHYAGRELRRTREEAADERVIAVGVNAIEYARHIVAVTKGAVSFRLWAVAVSMGDSQSIQSRLKKLLSGKSTPVAPARTVKVMAVLVFIAAGGIGVRFEAAAEPPQQEAAGEISDGIGSGKLLRTIAAAGAERTPAGFGGVVTVSRLSGESVWSKATKGRATSLAYSRDGQTLAVADGMGMASGFDGGEEAEPGVTIYSATSGEPQQQFRVLGGPVISMVFSADASVLRIVQNNRISTWDTESGEKISEFPASVREGRIRAAAFTPKGDVVAMSNLGDDVIVLVNATNGEELRRVRVNDTRASELAFSADGSLLASVCAVITAPNSRYDMNVHIWDGGTGTQMAQLSSATTPATSIAFMPSGERIQSPSTQEAS